RSMLRGPLGDLLSRYVKRLEAKTCDQADVIFAASDDDRRRFSELYRVSPDKIFVAPNGVDVGGTTIASDAERAQAKRQLGLEGYDVLLFIGSFHPPNTEAVDGLISSVAPRLPGATFLIAGTV